MPAHPTHRFLIFVVAYEARKHITSVFERVPEDLFNRPDIHFLVSDDASSDGGPELLKAWLIDRSIHNVTILQSHVNQGYGGNQKIGFRVAIDAGFDYVILLHGDGQYSPERLPAFIQTCLDSKPDVLLGSRLHSRRSALRGGMPLYKLLGNRLLTRLQNRMTGWSLDEYHTGYRAYSTDFLERVPFETNTNRFHFDTEILLQAAHVDATVTEIPIATHYGDEVCRVPGLQYAWDVICATIQFKMHQVGMLCSLKLRNLSTGRYRDKTRANYTSHSLAVELLQQHGALRLLDIGCGPGHVAARCRAAGMTVTGIDCSDPEPGSLDDFHRVDLEKDPVPASLNAFDAIIMLDVIEHLADPEQFLIALRHESPHSDTDPLADLTDGLRGRFTGSSDEFITSHSPNKADPGNTALRNSAVLQPPLFLLSTPNIAFAAIRLNLLLGRFNYAERGILDITHKRLFTRRSLLRLLNDCGYDIENIHPVGVPFVTVISGWKGRLLGWVAHALAKCWPSLFAFQFLVECRPRPGVRQILSSAIRVHRPDHCVTASEKG